MKKSFVMFAGLALACFLVTGCGDTKKDDKTDGGTKTVNKTDDGHDDHSHMHGPNSGHMFEITPDEYHGEWKQYSDNTKIKIFILDKDAKKNVAIKADSVKVIPRVGEDKTPFVLTAESPNEAGEAASFVLDDAKLKKSIPLGVDIEFSIGDKVYKGEIAAHAPMDH